MYGVDSIVGYSFFFFFSFLSGGGAVGKDSVESNKVCTVSTLEPLGPRIVTSTYVLESQQKAFLFCAPCLV